MLFTISKPPEPPLPPDDSPIDYSDDGPGMIGGCSVLIVLATVCVALRFWSKRLVHSKWLADDWLVLAALVVNHGFMATIFVQILRGGLGRDIRLVVAEDPNSLVIFYKAMFAADISYGLSSPLVKLSILCFYWRIFPTRTIRLGCGVIGSLCIGWMISILVVNLVQCRPLQAAWHMELQELPGTQCVDILLFFLLNSIANCIIDLATVSLPIPAVLRLRISTRKKVGIAGVFLLGGIAFAASLARTITKGIMYGQGKANFTKQNVGPAVVSTLEIYVAIIGACLPTMIPVYRKLRYGEVMSSGKRTLNKVSEGSESTEGFSERPDEGSMATMNYGVDQRSTVNSWAVAGAGPQRQPMTDDAMRGITVKSELEWSDNSRSHM